MRTTDVAVKTKQLKEKIKILTENNTRLAKNVTYMHGKHTERQVEFDKKAKAVQKASKRMATRSVLIATRNITSLPGQAIPLLGTSLIAAGTAWDIYDSCENMKDINELSDVFEHNLEDLEKVCGMEVPTKEQVMAKVRKNWQEAYNVAESEINLSPENAKVLIIQEYEDAKEKVIRTEENWENKVEETYTGAINKINQINTRIEIPRITDIWEMVINRIYALFGEFAQ